MQFVVVCPEGVHKASEEAAMRSLHPEISVCCQQREILSHSSSPRCLFCCLPRSNISLQDNDLDQKCGPAKNALDY